MRRYLDTPSTIVAAVTLALFVAALFVKGLTHDLFLEAGVFLVSTKILLMMHANHTAAIQIEKKIDTLLSQLARRNHTDTSSGTAKTAHHESSED